jgi:NADP-dependent 3-hydroxy acid dehydrogenase YdfG
MVSPTQESALAIITGASSGIGQACATVYAQAGFSLALGARRLDLLTEQKAALLAAGAKAVYEQKLDVRDERDVLRFATNIQDRFNMPAVLINNAGLALGRDSVATSKSQDWSAMVETNFLGLLRVSKAFLPWMIASHRGHIINVGSIAGLESYAGGAGYAGTKHGVRAISKALREELLGTGVRVGEIDPGMVETEFSIVRFGDPDQAKSVYEGMTPLKAMDVAQAIFFMTSRPMHVNIDQIVIQPTDQASVARVFRQTTKS